MTKTEIPPTPPDLPEAALEVGVPAELAEPAKPTALIGISNRVRHDLLNFCEDEGESSEASSKLRRQAFNFLMGSWNWAEDRLKPMKFPTQIAAREGEDETDLFERGAKAQRSRRDWEDEMENIELDEEQAKELEDLIKEYRKERKGKFPGRVGWAMTDLVRSLTRAFQED